MENNKMKITKKIHYLQKIQIQREFYQWNIREITLLINKIPLALKDDKRKCK